MKRKAVGDSQCPVARSIDIVGDWWSILILRDAFYGLTRFDEFEKSLLIAPNMLTRRLKTLAEGGILERRLYNDHPPRFEYVLTKKGRDFHPVLLSLVTWGNLHLAPEGASTLIADKKSGKILDPVLTDRRTGRALTSENIRIVPGPAAAPPMISRLQNWRIPHEAS